MALNASRGWINQVLGQKNADRGQALDATGGLYISKSLQMCAFSTLVLTALIHCTQLGLTASVPFKFVLEIRLGFREEGKVV